MEGFDRIAGIYDRLAGLVFGSSIKKAQASYLEHICASDLVLILGGGTGWVVTEILSRQPSAKIVYVESSQKMLALTKERVTAWPQDQISLILGTEKYLSQYKSHFDVVLTQFILDVYKPLDLEQTMKLLDQCMKPNGRWIFADFRLAHSWYQRWWQWGLVKLMYFFFKYATEISANRLVDFNAYFAALGWVATDEGFFYQKMIRAAIYRRSDQPNAAPTH